MTSFDVDKHLNEYPESPKDPVVIVPNGPEELEAQAPKIVHQPVMMSKDFFVIRRIPRHGLSGGAYWTPPTLIPEGWKYSVWELNPGYDTHPDYLQWQGIEALAQVAAYLRKQLKRSKSGAEYAANKRELDAHLSANTWLEDYPLRAPKNWYIEEHDSWHLQYGHLYEWRWCICDKCGGPVGAKARSMYPDRVLHRADLERLSHYH